MLFVLLIKKTSNQHDSVPIRGRKPPTHSEEHFIKLR